MDLLSAMLKNVETVLKTKFLFLFWNRNILWKKKTYMKGSLDDGTSLSYEECWSRIEDQFQGFPLHSLRFELVTVEVQCHILRSHLQRYPRPLLHEARHSKAGDLLGSDEWVDICVQQWNVHQLLSCRCDLHTQLDHLFEWVQHAE